MAGVDLTLAPPTDVVIRHSSVAAWAVITCPCGETVVLPGLAQVARCACGQKWTVAKVTVEAEADGTLTSHLAVAQVSSVAKPPKNFSLSRVC